MSVTRRENLVLRERDRVEATTVAAISATSSIALGTMDRDYVVDSFEIEVPGGYVSDATNRYTLTLQAGATVLATADFTPSGANSTGTLVDLVFAIATLAATHYGSAGDTLKVVLTKNGTAANIPAGTRLVAKCHLL